jgi:hypothetical protein
MHARIGRAEPSCDPVEGLFRNNRIPIRDGERAYVREPAPDPRETCRFCLIPPLEPSEDRFARGNIRGNIQIVHSVHSVQIRGRSGRIGRI